MYHVCGNNIIVNVINAVDITALRHLPRLQRLIEIKRKYHHTAKENGNVIYLTHNTRFPYSIKYVLLSSIH